MENIENFSPNELFLEIFSPLSCVKTEIILMDDDLSEGMFLFVFF